MATSLSVVIPTLNEEKDLPACLESLKNFADEVLVVDSGSTDNTIAIAKKFKAKIVNHKFISYSDQRNYCDTIATGDWILSIEADVVVSKELADEIKIAIQEKKFSAYFIERINIIWGKPIMHTDWGPKDDSHIWLYEKGAGKWVSEVHEEYKTGKPVGKLKNRLIHNNYETVSEFIDKIDRYSELAKNKGQCPSKLEFLINFCKRYFYKKGFLDGYHGLFLSYLQSIYYITLCIKKKLV